MAISLLLLIVLTVGAVLVGVTVALVVVLVVYSRRQAEPRRYVDQQPPLGDERIAPAP